MLNCCEIITASDKDCTYMTLMGGDMGILNAACTRNITLLYPNMVNEKSSIFLTFHTKYKFSVFT